MPSSRRSQRKPQQKVGKALKGFTEARKNKVDLLREVQAHVVAEGLRKGGEGREDHKIHVSEVVKDTACPRHMYYKINKVERSDPPTANFHLLESMWASGHQEHAKWQRWLDEMGRLWGNWKCLGCGRIQSNMTRPEDCDECGFNVLVYDEVHLEDEGYLLVGHADGAVPDLGALVEVKTFSAGTVRIEDPKRIRDHTYKVDGRSILDHEGLWNSIKRPLGSHLRQGMMYLWMCQRMGLPYDRIIFIYENKATQKTKTFEVRLAERFIQEFLNTLDQVVNAAEPPERPSLFAPGSKPCSTCVFRTKCWEETSGQTSEDESPAVPARRSRSRSQEAGGQAEVQPARPSRRGDPDRPRRHHGSGRPGTDPADDAADSLDRASRRAGGDGRGGRALGGRGGREGEGPRFTRRG